MAHIQLSTGICFMPIQSYTATKVLSKVTAKPHVHHFGIKQCTSSVSLQCIMTVGEKFAM